MSTLDRRWHKPTRSGSNGQCVEARIVDDLIEIRNSNDQAGGTVRFTRGEWETFIAAVVDDGEFRLA